MGRTIDEDCVITCSVSKLHREPFPAKLVSPFPRLYVFQSEASGPAIGMSNVESLQLERESEAHRVENAHLNSFFSTRS